MHTAVLDSVGDAYGMEKVVRSRRGPTDDVESDVQDELLTLRFFWVCRLWLKETLHRLVRCWVMHSREGTVRIQLGRSREARFAEGETRSSSSRGKC